MREAKIENLLETLPVSIRAVQTRPLFVMRLEVRRVLVLGATPGGYRRVGVVSGGTFEGDRISGDVLDGGNDWQHVQPDGTVLLDVRLVLSSGDGALIGMTYQGIRHGSPDILARIDAGEVLDPATHYFRIMPRFETASADHAWLNRVVAVGLGHRRADGVVYNVFEVL